MTRCFAAQRLLASGLPLLGREPDLGGAPRQRAESERLRAEAEPTRKAELAELANAFEAVDRVVGRIGAA